jgi:hypothetical protein
VIRKFRAIFRIWFCGKSIIPFFLIIFIFGLSKGLYPQNRDDEYRIPKKLNDGWEVASLSEVGIDPGKIDQITREIRNNERFDGIHSMLIVKNGKLVHVN